MSHDRPGLTKSLCAQHGINRETAKYRMRVLGMSREEALTTPVGAVPRKANPEHEVTQAMCDEAGTGVYPQMVRARLRRGWALEDALYTPPMSRSEASRWANEIKRENERSHERKVAELEQHLPPGMSKWGYLP